METNMISAEHKSDSSYKLTDLQYKKLNRIIYDSAGIDLGDNKKELVHARLSKILRKRKIKDFNEYLKLLIDDDSGDELITLLDAIATNVTHFFREESHFDFLIQHIVDNENPDSFRIWSAGCSSGEEPYSLAITFCEHMTNPFSSGTYILATDISTKILSRAMNGIYPMKSVEKLDRNMLKKYFLKGKNSRHGSVRIKKEISNMVTLERLNLIEPFQFDKGFDVIFCRNVMIYFDKMTRQNIVRKFYEALSPGGYLIIGHSESLNGIQHSFKYIKPTIYRRK